ncbi:glutamate receptor ionotropic, delta-1 [Chironomus tepperi]|uniref:glutamate receptor ionotropic, delta-1 n=1 Tax=Chironomus tepperi TaxID=113505 RepID=UPI00391EEBB5
MEGVALILSTICFNSTFCQEPPIVPQVNFVEFYKGEVFSGNIEIAMKEKQKKMDKIARDLKGQTLMITTIEDYPLSYIERVNDKLVLRGRAFDFLEILMKKFEFKYEVVLPNFNIAGSSNDSTGSIMEMLVQKKVDMAVAFIPYMADLLSHIEFSTPLDEGEWRMIMLRPQESASGAGLLAPFDEIVWYLILVSLIVTGPIIFCIVWLYCRFAKDDEEQKYYTLSQCVWYVYGALMKQGSTLTPTADSIRVVFATWWMFITILTSFYTANLTAFLTLSRFTLDINEPKDLLNKRHQFIGLRGSAVDYAIRNTNEELDFLMPMVEKNLGIFSNKNNDTDILLNQIMKKDYVFIRDKPAIDHLVYNDWRKRKTMPSERLQCPFALSKLSSLRRKRGFAFPIGSKWRPLFDEVLIHAVESGIVKHRLSYGLPKAEICPQNLGSLERQLRLNDLATTYLTMLVGFVTALVVFVSEIIMRYFYKRKARLIRDEGPRRIQVQPKKSRSKQVYPEIKQSPPPNYNDAIKTISSLQPSTSNQKSNVDSYRTFNGRTYAVVKTEGGTQLVPMRAPSAALFNYQYTYSNY